MATLNRSINPIFLRELARQQANQASLPAWMRLERPVALAAVALLVLVAFGSVQGRLPVPVELLAIWGVHGVILLRTIVAGADAFSREHLDQTWDPLALTGLSARRILFGKLRAVLHRLRFWIVLLIAVRLIMPFINTIEYVDIARNLSSSFFVDLQWLPWSMTLSVVMIVILSVLDISACAALSMAASALTRRSIQATVMAGLIRFVPVVVFFFGALRVLGEPARSQFWLFIMQLALADGGSTVTMLLLLPTRNGPEEQYFFEMLPALFVVTALLAILFGVSLLVTLRILRRNGALSQQ
jgi:hypothetical protein